LTKYAPRGIRNQGRPLKMLLDQWDRNRPAMAYFPECKMMMMMMMIYFLTVWTRKHFIVRNNRFRKLQQSKSYFERYRK
jgi:hypothetical protein